MLRGIEQGVKDIAHGCQDQHNSQNGERDRHAAAQWHE